LLATGLLLALVLPGDVILSFAGLFLLVLGAAMMTPLLIRGLHFLLRHASLPGTWRMGVRDLDRHLSRLGIAVAALMVALSASVGVGVMVDSMRGAVDSWLVDLLNADLYVAAEGFDEGARMPDTVVTEITALPAVAEYSSYRYRNVTLDGRRIEVIGARLAARSRDGYSLLEKSPATWQVYEAGGALVSEPLANRLGLEPGMSVQLPTSTGKQSIQVAAVIRDYASEHGRIVLADTAYQAFWPGEKVRTLALFAADAKQQDLRRQVSEVIAGTDMFMTRATDIRNESMAVFDRTFRITEVLRVVSLSVAFIGVLSALMALQLERGKEYAVLRALGLTRGQIAGLISGESLLMGMLAACVAIPTGVLMAWVLIESVQKRAFGWTMPFHVDGVLLLQTLLVGVLAAGLAAIYPAWRSANRDPAPQLRED
jgi:putative ABC transport system permease protein